MGQKSVKLGLAIQSQARSLADGVSTRLHSVTEFKCLTYDEFIHEVSLLNEV